MPQSTPTQTPSSTSYGQVIEYIKDRLYLASYTHPPNDQTPFPYTAKQDKSPTRRSAARTQGPTPLTNNAPPTYITVDRLLLYNAFHADFGPLHIGHLYRFAVMLHEVLGDQDKSGSPVVFWSNADSRSRANAACILACYMVLIQDWPPHLALAPIAQMDPPCMPFRDAGYSQADYGLAVQDVVYGVWKAKEEKLCGLSKFSLEEYETFERVDMGDFNWVTPSFLAFASPQHAPTHVIAPTDPFYATIPRNVAAVQRSKLPRPFRNVLSHFHDRGIGLVVRLNSELYSPSYFTALGIKHLDMIFDDGTCPPLSLVRRFVDLANEMINVRQKGIAVHCKAGLGRTGCLIGAYLVYRHGFTANEVIAFMRFMRPGMVVGPQQHWLHLNQGTFREWWFEDTMRAKIAASMAPATPTKAATVHTRQRLNSIGQTFTPPANHHGSQRRAALGEIAANEKSTTSESYYSSIGVQDENLPAPTPGQPRKTSKVFGTGSQRRNQVRGENEPFGSVKPNTEIVSVQRTTMNDNSMEEESEAEYSMRLLSARKTSQSPASRSGKRRAVSCTTTTTTMTKWDLDSGMSDIENGRTSRSRSRTRNQTTIQEEEMPDTQALSPIAPSTAAMASSIKAEQLVEAMSEAATLRDRKPKTPATASRSGSGAGSLTVGKRNSASRRSTEGRSSVRKPSSRVASRTGPAPVV